MIIEELQFWMDLQLVSEPGKTIVVVHSTQVPAKGDIVRVKPHHYEIVGREWQTCTYTNPGVGEIRRTLCGVILYVEKIKSET